MYRRKYSGILPITDAEAREQANSEKRKPMPSVCKGGKFMRIHQISTRGVAEILSTSILSKSRVASEEELMGVN